MSRARANNSALTRTPTDLWIDEPWDLPPDGEGTSWKTELRVALGCVAEKEATLRRLQSEQADIAAALQTAREVVLLCGPCLRGPAPTPPRRHESDEVANARRQLPRAREVVLLLEAALFRALENAAAKRAPPALTHPYRLPAKRPSRGTRCASANTKPMADLSAV